MSVRHQLHPLDTAPRLSWHVLMNHATTVKHATTLCSVKLCKGPYPVPSHLALLCSPQSHAAATATAATKPRAGGLIRERLRNKKVKKVKSWMSLPSKTLPDWSSRLHLERSNQPSKLWRRKISRNINTESLSRNIRNSEYSEIESYRLPWTSQFALGRHQDFHRLHLSSQQRSFQLWWLGTCYSKFATLTETKWWHIDAQTFIQKANGYSKHL